MRVLAVIPGPSEPQHIEPYIQPLIDDLKKFGPYSAGDLNLTIYLSYCGSCHTILTALYKVDRVSSLGELYSLKGIVTSLTSEVSLSCNG